MELVCYHCRYVLLTSRFWSLLVTFYIAVVKLVVASELENNAILLFLNLDFCDVLGFYQDMLVFCLLLGLGHTNLTSILRSILKYLKTLRACGTKASQS